MKNSTLLATAATAGCYFVAPAAIPFAAFVGYQLGGFIDEKKIKDKIFYGNYQQNGSYLNYYFANNNIKFTKLEFVKDLMQKENEDNFYLNNFRFDSKVKRHFNLLNRYLANKAEAKEIRLNWSDLKRGNLIVGKMGTGKSEFLKNIIVQWLETGRKIVVHDTKGEFTSFFYDEETDFILNMSDKRGFYWDFFEDIAKGMKPGDVLNIFFKAYFKATNGESNDKFWETASYIRFQEIFNEVVFDETIKTENKYEVFLIKLTKYFKDTLANNNKTEQSIAITLQTACNIFYESYALKKLGRKKFSIMDFFFTENKSKVFLQTISKTQKEITPFISAFLELLFRYQLTYFESAKKEQFILYVLDEYLSFFNLMDEKTRTEVHTKARSAGALLLPAVQYLPSDDKVAQDLTASLINIVAFNMTDNKMIKYLEDMTKTTIETRSKVEKETDFSRQEVNIVNNEIIQELGVGKHIFITEKNGKKIIYQGYTKQAHTNTIAKTFDEDVKLDETVYREKKRLEELAVAENFE